MATTNILVLSGYSIAHLYTNSAVHAFSILKHHVKMAVL